MNRVSATVLELNTYTDLEKRAIAYEIKPITDKIAVSDFIKLRAYDHHILNLSRIGNKAVDRFTYAERLETKGRKGVNFFDVFANRVKLSNEKYIKNLYNIKVARSVKSKAESALWIAIMEIYFSSINIFRPLVAANIYARFNPECVLDPTMGWGGRLVGAMACDVPRYIGIDNNKKLSAPYSDMVSLLGPMSKTKATLLFENALDVDYDALDYDMLLTSPPYYNIECYGDAGSPYASTEEWNTKFYIPLITRTYKGLRAGGHFCLNVQSSLYESVCEPLLGPATLVIELKKVQRQKSKYTECIYVWIK